MGKSNMQEIQKEVNDALAGNLPLEVLEYQKLVAKRLKKFDIIGVHTQINTKRLPPEGHKPESVHGRKIAKKFSRKKDGQPYHGDIIPGQLVLRKKDIHKSKYNPDGSLKQKQG
jgi:hypothetical protein